MQKIRIDFDNPGLPQHISAVENDSQSRFFQATLYENGKAYTAPEGAAYSIMYRGFGPQNQGWYDTINDGAGKRAACAVSGNVVTCEIARQALQVPGHVSIVLCVTTGKGYMLKSWPIECDCKNDRYDSTVEIQSFFYVTQISNESWTQAIQAVEELKNTIDPTLSLSGKAADAAKVGEAVNAEATRAKAAEEENAKGVSQLKEDVQKLSNDGRINIEGTDHNYYFGGGINYSDLIISNLTFTKVFPIEHGKTYHVINSGNTCSIGFANEEYTEGGKLSDNVKKSEHIFDFTNDGKYTFLYVYYSTGNKEKQGDCLLEAYTNIVLKELLYKKTAEDYNVLNQFISSGFNKIVPVDENIKKGYFVNNTGSLVANDVSDAHTNIKVRRGYKIRIKNAYCAYSRSICAYKENGDYVKTLATNMGQSAFNAEFDVDDYDKISVTSKSNDEIAIEYIGIVPIQATDSLCESIDEGNATSNGTGNYYNPPAFVLNQGEFTDGYLAGRSVLESTALYYSPYISVLDEQVITLKNAFVGGFTKAVFYDADKKYIGYVKSDDNYYTATYEVRIPYGAHYMRFNVNKATDFSLVGVEYTQKIERNYKQLNLTKRWYSDSYEKIDQLFKKATEKPICCIIDDDSPSADAMETFAVVMENNGVQGTIACLTAVMNSHQDLKSKLLELERRGHQIVLHGYTQNEAYKTAVNIGDENYKIAEDDFVHGLHDLISAGFVNCKFWVTPYGVSQKCLQQLARKWGMECLITTAKKEFNRTDGKFSRYEIQRSGLNAADTGALSQAELIELADKCAAENGWLLVNTHITDGWNKDFTRINEFILHCKENGFEFMTLGEAWRARKPIYDWYDTF